MVESLGQRSRGKRLLRAGVIALGTFVAFVAGTFLGLFLQERQARGGMPVRIIPYRYEDLVSGRSNIALVPPTNFTSGGFKAMNKTSAGGTNLGRATGEKNPVVPFSAATKKP